MPLPAIVAQHAEEAAAIRGIRSRLLRAPHVRLRDLSRFDRRLEAHLDGLAIAGESSWHFCKLSLEGGSAGDVFVAAIHALTSLHEERLQRLLSLALADADAKRGLTSAFGWVSKALLRGVVKGLLDGDDPGERLIGIAVCSMQRTDPGFARASYTEDPDPLVRARSLRALGELGRAELVRLCHAALRDEHSGCRFWAAWSAVLLGERGRALELTADIALPEGPFRRYALQLALSAMDVATAHELLTRLGRGMESDSLLVWGAGIVGDPAYVPWLLRLMNSEPHARRAGESFALLSGTDLAWHHLDRPRPGGFESGPNDDPDNRDLEVDEDDDLPWPDPIKVQAWWHANSHRFQPGVRYFMGQPLNRENCVRVLKEGFQRQRIAAALHLCLLNPGTPLFEWRAPAWRQQRLLAEMS
jgi:uncharacterized protein (TIGR02270 family)